MEQKQKIETYIKAEIAPSDDVHILDIPGDFIVSLVNSQDNYAFSDLSASSIDFSDVREDGKNYCTQKATIKCSGKRDLGLNSCIPQIVRLTTSTGRQVIVGNNEYPVRFSFEQSGKPIQTIITIEHHHPEHVKELV